LQLKEFSLINPIIESSEGLKAIETAIPSEMIETGTRVRLSKKFMAGFLVIGQFGI
jgi:hypothetical protein